MREVWINGTTVLLMHKMCKFHLRTLPQLNNQLFFAHMLWEEDSSSFYIVGK